MKGALRIILATAIVIFGQADIKAQFQPSAFSKDGSVELVPWNSKEGIKRLDKSKHKSDFYQLADHFQPQINPLYCGIATTTIILNSFRMGKSKIPSQQELEVQKPQVLGGDKIPFQSYSQRTLLNEQTDKVKLREIIDMTNITENNTQDHSQFEPGLSLDQLSRIQEIYGLSTDVTYADLEPAIGVEHFRKDVIRAVCDTTSFIVVNFVGNLIGTTTGGHISPVAAYHKKTDCVLVLDVAGHKNPWYWVPLEHLYRSMNSRDGDKFRGWLIITN